MYNPNAVVTIGENTTTGVEGIANWTATNVNTACSGSGNTTCGYSQPYAVTLRSGQFAYVFGTSNNIYVFAYNSTTGVLNPVGSVDSYGSNQVGMAISIDGNYVYLVDQAQSAIKSFAVDSDGMLTYIESIPTGNSPSASSLRFDPTGKYLYSSAAGAQNITVFSYNSINGHLTQQSTISSGAHPSFMSFTPNGKYLYVSNDLGVVPPTVVSNDARISMYQVQPNGDLSALSPESSIKSLDNNPFASIVDPSGKYLYVTNVGPLSAGMQYATNTLTIFSINQATGALSYNPAQNLAQVESAPVAIITDPLGKYMYVANGVSGSISQLSVDPKNGSVLPLTPATVNSGVTPVSLIFSPDKKFVYSVSQYGNFIQMYNYSAVTGQLTPNGSPIPTGSATQSGFILFGN